MKLLFIAFVFGVFAVVQITGVSHGLWEGTISTPKGTRYIWAEYYGGDAKVYLGAKIWILWWNWMEWRGPFYQPVESDHRYTDWRGWEFLYIDPDTSTYAFFRENFSNRLETKVWSNHGQARCESWYHWRHYCGGTTLRKTRSRKRRSNNGAPTSGPFQSGSLDSCQCNQTVNLGQPSSTMIKKLNEGKNISVKMSSVYTKATQSPTAVSVDVKLENVKYPAKTHNDNTFVMTASDTRMFTKIITEYTHRFNDASLSKHFVATYLGIKTTTNGCDCGQAMNFEIVAHVEHGKVVDGEFYEVLDENEEWRIITIVSVLGSLALIAAIIIIVVCIRRKKSRKVESNASNVVPVAVVKNETNAAYDASSDPIES